MILSVERGSFGYPKGELILKDVNFSVSPGEILSILGPNGAGKTTLLRCVMGMLRWKAGKSCLDGEDIRTMPANKLWRHMAYVPQARGASGAFTAFEAVLLGRTGGLHVFSAPKREDAEQAKAVMERLGILHLAEKKCSAISGGELQMVLIARALAAQPQVLILDEPESNLDFRNQLIVLDTMTRLAQEGMTCVFNTHYPAHALQRSHKALLLSKGGEYVFGDTSRVVTEENIHRAFGVRAVIGEVETREKILPSVVPVSVADAPECAGEERVIASITVIANDNAAAEQINALLHDYSPMLIGRMGMPYRRSGVYIINMTLDGAREEIEALNHKLCLLPGVSAKTTYAQGSFREE